MAYQWPQELDDPQLLLGLVGSFWEQTYQGNDLVAATLHAKAQQQAQLHLDLLELIASISRFNVPIFHRENWAPLRLLESQRNALNLAHWNGVYAFNSGLSYDVPVATPNHGWAAPATLVTAGAILNRIAGATRTYLSGLDFVIDNGQVVFRTDPFLDPDGQIEPVYQNGEIVDRALQLWIYAGQHDWKTVYEQFGYVVGLNLRSSETYRNALNAVFDALCEGTTVRSVEQFVSACCDVPLAQAAETIEQVLDDGKKLWIITPQHAYGFRRAATPLVAVGDAVVAGQALTDALQFFDFNRGQVPAAIRAATLGRGLLTSGFYGGLTFENAEVPLEIVASDDGYTRVEFAITGWPDDVTKFWDDFHARGVAAGQTLAMLLDQRPVTARTSQPTALALPATINPFGFLCENVFRNGAFAVVLKPSLFGPNALGLSPLRLLRRLLPPHVLAMLFVYLSGEGDEAIMDSAGSDTAPGAEEEVTSFSGTSVSDDVDAEDFTEDAGRCYSVAAACQ